MSDKKLDVCGYCCPVPLIRTKQLLSTMKSGEVLEVVADNHEVTRDLPSYIKATNNELMSLDEINGQFILKIRKK